jgi:predicted acylesterase/phospholipase RssA
MAKLGLVLSGGSIRGVAHIGMLKALEEHDLLKDIEVVVGTSAGSIVASMFAVGYTPGEMWEIWDKDVWRLFGGKKSASAVEDRNWSGLLDAIIHFDPKRFRGYIKGNKLLKALQCYLTPNDPCTSIRPTGKKRPLYVLSTDFNTGQETVWCFTRHVTPADALEGAEAEADQFEPAPGRQAFWEVRRDDDPQIQQFPSLAEVCRCSASIPMIFVPARAPIKCTDGTTIDNLYTDGGVRDNYSLSTAVKLAGCDRVIGMFLSSLVITNKPWDGLIDLQQRTMTQMGMTIFEADQDDAQIRTTDIRTLVPYFAGQITTFDIKAMKSLYHAGHRVTKQFLKAVEAEMRKQHMTGPITWDAIFSITDLGSESAGATLSPARPRASLRSATAEEAQPLPDVKYYIYSELPPDTQP